MVASGPYTASLDGDGNSPRMESSSWTRVSHYCTHIRLVVKVQPNILLRVAKSPEILLHQLVSMLCLPVCLWLEGCREPMIIIQVRSYPGPESACELGATICHHVAWDAALADNMIKAEPGQLRQVDILPAWSVDCQLCQSVHEDKNFGVAQSG